jgi:hypothetical protein
MRSTGRRRIAPAQSVTIDEGDPAQHPAIIHPRLPWPLGKQGRRRAIYSSSSQYRLLISSLLRSLNQIVPAKSMVPEPSPPWSGRREGTPAVRHENKDSRGHGG